METARKTPLPNISDETDSVLAEAWRNVQHTSNGAMPDVVLSDRLYQIAYPEQALNRYALAA